MAAKEKKRIMYSETYKKGVEVKKSAIIEFINQAESKVFVAKAGKYDDGKEFMTITIDNIDV